MVFLIRAQLIFRWKGNIISGGEIAKHAAPVGVQLGNI